MAEFSPERLFIEYKLNDDNNEIKEGRKYTLTHSDETADLYLTIGDEYDYSKINPTRDEVIAEWINEEGQYKLKVQLQISLDSALTKTIIRDKIFRRELPLALSAIVYGDREFLNDNRELYNAPIIVYFKSEINEYNSIEQWGIINDYKYEKMIRSDSVDIHEINDKLGEANKIILRLLSRYIKIQINLLFGRDAVYCINDAEILYFKKIDNEKYLPEEYEVSVGIKVGSPIPKYNNAVINFLIYDNVVEVKDFRKIKK